jgi:hypothetical protein
MEHARAYGSLRGELRVQIGRANLAHARGNYPQSDAMLVDTIREANRYAFSDIRSMAYHGRAAFAIERGDYEAALPFAFCRA